MTVIENGAGMTPVQRQTALRELDDAELLAQDLVQQGAVHALSALLRMGCTESNVVRMLADLRANAQRIREEASRRGKPSLFADDQTGFS